MLDDYLIYDTTEKNWTTGLIRCEDGQPMRFHASGQQMTVSLTVKPGCIVFPFTGLCDWTGVKIHEGSRIENIHSNHQFIVVVKKGAYGVVFNGAFKPFLNMEIRENDGDCLLINYKHIGHLQDQSISLDHHYNNLKNKWRSGHE